MKKAISTIIIFIISVLVVSQIENSIALAQGGGIYYISPSGNDSKSGTSEVEAWASFNRAWQDIYPGDTLILLDGVYYQSLNPNKRNGEPGKPITIRAKNDGKAIIDGEGQRIPVKLGDTWPGPIGDYFVVEGIVARNGSDSVYYIRGNNNVLRRVSGYDASTNTNSAVLLIWASNNVIEDCIASGTGRKMINIYKGNNNIVRRCFADWRAWDGRDFCGVTWPNGGNIHIYNSDHNIVENSIAYGPVAKWSTLIQANSSGATAIGNKILGSIAINAGMNRDGSVKEWEDTRPQPTSCTGLTDLSWGGHRAGFKLYGQGELRDNLFQDIFSWGNAGLGFSYSSGAGFHPNTGNNRMNYATIFNNGLDNPYGPWPGKYGGKNTDVLQAELSRLDSVENSYIENIFIDWPDYPNGERNLTSMNGEGARLTHRYVDGVLTNEPLWPWPMEDRIQAELGISVADEIQSLVETGSGYSPTPTPTNEPTSEPTNEPTPNPTSEPTPQQSIPLILDGPISVNSGETFQMNVIAQNVPTPGLYGVQFEINYDPSLISVTDLQVNPNLSFVVLKSADNTTGKITLVASQKGQVSGLTGDVTLLNFQATAADTEGTATFSFENEKFSDFQAQGFDITAKDYSVAIGQVTTPEPTQEPTSEPTNQPTPEPTIQPTHTPTLEPTPPPTTEPTAEPTIEPTPNPTSEPTPQPTSADLLGQVIFAGRSENNWSGATVVIDNGNQNTVTDQSGNFNITDLAPGLLNSVAADASGYLSAVCRDVIVTAPKTVLVPVTLLSGDITDDDLVDIVDATAVGASFGQTGQNLPADLTLDEAVDIFDIVLVSVNFGEEGPIAWNCLNN